MKPQSTLLETAPPAAAAEPAKRRVFLVEDHPVTRRGVAVLLNQQPDLAVCGEADSAARALELMQKQNPDIAVIDIGLKTTSGIELIKNVRVLLPELPILVMSMYSSHHYAERAIRAGARGYITKAEASDRVLAAIRSVLAGELYLNEDLKEHMLNRLMGVRRNDGGLPIDALSDRELEVFKLIGNGYSTREIAGRLNLSVKTVDSYREHLKLKLELKDASDLLRRAIEWERRETTVGVP
jgi:DNA-binding NarL/FixJ family response regulator